MTCGHLFNGIGGFALAASWMNWENVMHCEIDPFCNKVMNHHFPNSHQHEDIRTTDFTIWRGKIDLITGGFPCQPYSTAGKRKGKDDDRHLWPQMLRAIREIQPGWIVGENVRGLTNWNGGLVFDEVQADLEAEGYEVLPFLLPAAGVGAPHKRDRIWFIAHRDNRQRKHEEGQIQAGGRAANDICNEQSPSNTKGIGRDNGVAENKRKATREKHAPGNTTKICIQQHATYTKRFRLPVGDDQQNRWSTQSITKRSYGITDWANFPTQPPVCNRNDGLSGGLADITFSKWRKESIKALGNSVVPKVVFQIFKAIEQYNLCAE